MTELHLHTVNTGGDPLKDEPTSTEIYRSKVRTGCVLTLVLHSSLYRFFVNERIVCVLMKLKFSLRVSINVKHVGGGQVRTVKCDDEGVQVTRAVL